MFPKWFLFLGASGLAATLAIGCARRQPLLVPGNDLLPHLEEISPDAASEEGNVVVRLRATRLRSPVRVYFGGSSARIVQGTRRDVATYELLVEVPPHSPGRVPVRIVSGAGTPSEREVFRPNCFRYFPRLRVDHVEPSTVPASGNRSVRLIGGGFVEEVRVFVDDQPVSTLERLSDDTLVVVVPPHAPGKVSLTLLSPAERMVLPDVLTYEIPSVVLRRLFAIRLVDGTSAEILDARWEVFEERLEAERLSSETLWEYIAGRIAEALPWQLLRSSGESLGLVTFPDGEEATSLGVALARTLRGRGVNVLFGAETFGLRKSSEEEPLPDGTLLLRAESLRVSKVLIVRLIPLESASAFDALLTEYERLKSLGSHLPEIAVVKTTLLFRLPDAEGDALLQEDAVLAGVRQRIPVIEKWTPLTIKPPWLMRNVATPTDPLGYSSWEEFRKVLPCVESVFFYKPDRIGLYGRLVATDSGRILWSGRLLRAEEIFSEAFEPNVHDQIRNLADRSEWNRHIPEKALLWVTPLNSEPNTEEWAGIVSSLRDAGVEVLEPMITLYRHPRVRDERVWFVEDTATSDAWFDLVRAGVTHVLEYTRNGRSLSFRLLNATSGAVEERGEIVEAEDEDF